MKRVPNKNGTRNFVCRYHRGALLVFLTKTVHQKATSIIVSDMLPPLIEVGLLAYLC